jgi:hypothetical protein
MDQRTPRTFDPGVLVRPQRGRRSNDYRTPPPVSCKSIIATLPGMPDKTYECRIVIDWRRVANAPPIDFDWRITPEPPGPMTDGEISRSLKEIAERI